MTRLYVVDFVEDVRHVPQKKKIKCESIFDFAGKERQAGCRTSVPFRRLCDAADDRVGEIPKARTSPFSDGKLPRHIIVNQTRVLCSAAIRSGLRVVLGRGGERHRTQAAIRVTTPVTQATAQAEALPEPRATDG